MSEPTPDVVAARGKWANTGARRPDGAVEPGPGQESVWDYPRPPAIVDDSRRVVIGEPSDPLADTIRAVRILETASPPTVYVPADDVRTDRIVVAPGASMCEWKGRARYWALRDQPGEPIGWDYPEPFPEFLSIAGYLAFYPAKIECRIDDEVVRPQAGGFYGGWVTDEIVGPYKGEPGTGSW
ncbi:MAG: DUF427 domain-containing protein [Actinomycetota bacterium]